MRIQIIGSNARTGSSRYADSYLTMAGLMRDGLNAAGHSAEIADQWDDTGADVVFVGIASPLAVSSSRVFSALLAVARLWGDPRLRLFIDDPETRVIRNAISSAAADPEKLLSPYLQKRMLYDEMTERAGPWDEVVSALHLLNDTEDEPYPVMHIPAYPWGNEYELLRERSWHTVPVAKIDLTSFLRKRDSVVALQETRKAKAKVTTDGMTLVSDSYWLGESNNVSWASSVAQGVRNPVQLTGKRNKGYVLSQTYQAPGVIGVMEEQLSPYGGGWWTPSMGLAADAGIYYYHSSSDVMRRLRDPYGYLLHLPGGYEDLSESARLDVIRYQQDSLAASTSQSAFVVERLLES